jgi:hypothetical protein
MAKSTKQVKSSKGFGIRFYFPAARPGAGSALASHTAAFLQLSGLDNGDTVPRKVAEEIWGKRAVSNHLSLGNIERTDTGIRLTEQGFLHFGNLQTDESRNRNIRPDPEMVKSYVETMTTGKTSAMVKNATQIKAVAK